MILFVVIVALLAAGVVAWAAERVVGATGPRTVSVLAFAAGVVWTASLWLNGPDANGLYAAMDWAWIPRFGIHVALEMDGCERSETCKALTNPASLCKPRRACVGQRPCRATSPFRTAQ